MTTQVEVLKKRLDRLGGYVRPYSLRGIFDQTAMGLEPDLTGATIADVDYALCLIKSVRLFMEIGSGDSDAGYRMFREFCDAEYPETLDDMLDIAPEGFATDVTCFREHVAEISRT